jgi:ribonuclease P protein component
VVLHVLLASDLHAARVGFAVSKKVGNAVIRNRVRRRLQAIIRPLLGVLPERLWLVCAARRGAARATFFELKESCQGAFAQAGLLPAGTAGAAEQT